MIDQPEFGGWQQPGGIINQGLSAQLRSDFSSGGGGGAPCWVPARNGQVPPEAVQGGNDGMKQTNFQFILLSTN